LLSVRRLIFASYVIVALATVFAVLVSRLGVDESMLARWTEEGGPFENATVAALLLFGIGCWMVAWRSSRKSLDRVLLALLGFLLVVAAMEEMSWGQRVVGFETPDSLEALNYQGEFNIHNLVDSEIFAALVHTPVYLLIYGPMLIALFPTIFNRPVVRLVRDVPMPDGHNVLIFIFGTGLHAWAAPITLADSIACLAALVLFGLVMWRRPGFRANGELAHWILVAIATLVFALSYSIFRYENMQYEIRELVVVIGVAYWLAGWGADGDVALE
jgi:hypothetical protein